MSLIDTVRSWFSSEGGSTSKRLYVVDAARLVDEKTGAKLGPREQVQVLQQLSRFAGQEKVKMVAVFEGRALREVENGGEFNGVTVHFVDQASAVPDMILKLQRKHGPSSVVVVTSDVQLEKSASAQGGVTLRASTFRKAFGGGSNGGGGGGGGNGDRSRQQGRRRHFRPRGGGGPSSSAPADASREDSGSESAEGDNGSSSESRPAPSAPSSHQGGGEKDAVRNLIDLVE